MRVVFAILALFALVGAKPHSTSPRAGVDWSRTVTPTRGGSYVIGNPAAKVRLVEYMSYTCPHCGEFAEQGAPLLMRDYVAKGLISFELRNAVRDKLDLAAALAARCGGASRFPGNHEAIFAAQRQMFEKADAWAATPAAQVSDPNEGLKALARGAGLSELLARRGVTPAALDACVVAKPNQTAVLGMTREAWEVRKIPGTPAFFLNDKPVGANTWAGIEPEVRKALGLKPKAG